MRDDATTGCGEGAAESAEELAVRARSGCRSSYARLVERFEEPLVSFLRMRTGSSADAEELAQDAFLRAWQRIETYDETWRFSTWLFAIAGRLAASRFRRLRIPTVGEEALAGAASSHDPAREAVASDERANLWRLAGRVLSAEQRSALWLFYAEDLSAREVARVLAKRESTVRVILFRARERLARHLPDPRSEPHPRPAPAGYPSAWPARSAGGPS